MRSKGRADPTAPHLHFALRGSNDASKPNPRCKAWVGRIADVILHQVPPEPVGEVEPLVIKRDEDVGDEGGHFGQDPPLHLGPGLLDDY